MCWTCSPAGLSFEQILDEMPDLEREDIIASIQFATRRIDSCRHRCMKVWIDAQLSPGLARWLSEHHAVDAFSAPTAWAS